VIRWLYPLRAHAIDGTNNWIVNGPFFVDYHGTLYGFEDDFMTDFATVPRIFWAHIGHPTHHTHRRSAVIHDLLCRRRIVSRTTADIMFRRMCRAEGCSAAGAWARYLFVSSYTIWLSVVRHVPLINTLNRRPS